LPPPVFTSIQWQGSNVSLTFTTTSNRLHAVERNDTLVPNSWSTFTSGIPGNGSNATVSDPESNAAQGFYRVRLLP
jgi:hypothetical protein